MIVPPHYDRYIRFSRMAGAIYGEYTDRIEPFGLGEAWLDISGGGTRQGSGREVADEIRQRIRDELGITASVGVSFNKVFAKLGSDMKKPDATTVLSRDNYRQRAWPLPAEALLCVGTATCRKLRSRGIYTIGQLAATDPGLLQAWFGKWGLTLHCFANGRDSSPVRPAGQEAAVKSVGNSSTTPRDLMNEQDARVTFAALAESVGARLREYGLKGSTVQISLRDHTLASFERQMRLQAPTALTRELFEAAMTLLQRHYDWRRPLRSVGSVSYTHLLATAKACWEELKQTLNNEERESHPARYALVEVVNLHDPALTFEPIHRVLFDTDAEAFLRRLEDALNRAGCPARRGASGKGCPIGLVRAEGEDTLWMELAPRQLPVALLQPALDEAMGPGETLDFIHGEEAVRALCAKPGRLGLILPPFDKGALFPTVQAQGPLPRKSFSMGEAHEKRYYFECRRIRSI